MPNLSKHSFQLISFLFCYFVAEVASASFFVSQVKVLDSANIEINSRYTLTCQLDAGVIEDNRSGQYFEVTSPEQCLNLTKVAQLISKSCHLKINTSTNRVDGFTYLCK